MSHKHIPHSKYTLKVRQCSKPTLNKKRLNLLYLNTDSHIYWARTLNWRTFFQMHDSFWYVLLFWNEGSMHTSNISAKINSQTFVNATSSSCPTHKLLHMLRSLRMLIKYWYCIVRKKDLDSRTKLQVMNIVYNVSSTMLAFTKKKQKQKKPFHVNE